MINVSIDRRRLLLGLAAAASTAAAVSTGTAGTATAENPELLALSARLPQIAERYHLARDAYSKMDKGWCAATPLAPDELTIAGTALTIDSPDQPGEGECTAMGGPLIRHSEQFPRRIVIRSWAVRGKLAEVQRQKRRAKKDHSAIDFWHFEEEAKRLKSLLRKAEIYEADFQLAREAAKADHERLFPELKKSRDALETHIDAIMAAPDWTPEGLIIKAEAIAEWGKGQRFADRLTFKNWYAQIAESVLRHAKGVIA